MHGAEVEIQAASISLVGSFRHPSKAPSITIMTSGVLSRLLENGQDWELKVRDPLLEVGIECVTLRYAMTLQESSISGNRTTVLIEGL